MAKTTILIVEDDAGLREALYDTLLLGDYDVVDADCAESALMVLSGRKIDLVVSDIQMAKENKVAWHAGKSKWKNFTNLNKKRCINWSKCNHYLWEYNR